MKLSKTDKRKVAIFGYDKFLQRVELSGKVKLTNPKSPNLITATEGKIAFIKRQIGNTIARIK